MLQHFVISYYLKIKMPEGHCRIIKGGMCNGDLRRMHGEEKGERINVGIEGSADRDRRNHRLLGFMGLIVFLIIAVVAGVGAYFVSLNANLEYEYLYVDKQLTVDKIMARTRRKKVETFDLERMEILAPIKSWHLDDYKNRQLKVVDYSSGVEQQPDIRYSMIYNGEKRVIFEPNAEMVAAIKSIAPRKVFTD